jgi:hypothetical protein
MTSFVATMNKNVNVSEPYKGNKEKVKEIRDRLIQATQKSAVECVEAHQKSAEYAKKKRLK